MFRGELQALPLLLGWRDSAQSLLPFFFSLNALVCVYYWQQNSCYAEAMQEISIETINNLGFRFTAPSWTRTIINRNYFRLEEKIQIEQWEELQGNEVLTELLLKNVQNASNRYLILTFKRNFLTTTWLGVCIRFVYIFFYIFSLCYLQVFSSRLHRSEKNRMYDLWATVPPKVKICNLMCTKKCSIFGLINLMNTQILWKKITTIKFFIFFVRLKVQFFTIRGTVAPRLSTQFFFRLRATDRS